MSTYFIFLFSYILGSFTIGYLYFFLKNKGDIRKFGSGNVGATNLFRVLGKKAGITTLIFDFFKGFCVVFYCTFNHYSFYIAAFAGMFAVLGHVFPFWLQFKGGKGVATTFGVVSALDPVAALVAAFAWLVCFKSTSVSSLSSVISMITIAVSFFYREDDFFGNLALSLIIILVIFKHRDNIARLFKGKELKFHAKNRN